MGSNYIRIFIQPVWKEVYACLSDPQRLRRYIEYFSSAYANIILHNYAILYIHAYLLFIYIGHACRDDRAALKLLCMLLQKKTMQDSILHIYEEYEVKYS